MILINNYINFNTGILQRENNETMSLQESILINLFSMSMSSSGTEILLILKHLYTGHNGTARTYFDYLSIYVYIYIYTPILRST